MPRQTDDMSYHANTSSLRGILHAALGATKPNDGLKNLINQCDLFASYQGNPHGFTDSTDAYTDISFTDGTNTFQISPFGANFDVWVHGKRYRFTSLDQVVIAEAEGIWYFYYTGAGVLTGSQTPWDLETDTPVALIYWDDSAKASTAFVDYRLSIYQRWMDKKVDTATGYSTRYSEGLTPSNYTTSGDGSLDSDAQLDVAAGKIFVNDLEVDITDGTTGTSEWEQTLSPAEAPIYYLNTATPVWDKVAANAYPVYDNTPNEINYNLDTAGTWSAAQATQGYFVAMWLCATSEYSEPVILILGQREDATLAEAKINNRLEDLTLPSLPVPDVQPLYRLIFETDTSFTNTPRAALRDVQDLRAVRFVDGEYIPPPAGDLAGSDISLDTTNFDKAFTSNDDDVQTMAETADEKIGRVILPSEDAAAIINAATGGEEFILAEGTHNLSGAITLDVTEASIIGTRSSILAGTVDNLVTINNNDVLIEGFHIEYTPAAGGYTAISVGGGNHSRMTVRNITCNINTNDANFVQKTSTGTDTDIHIEGCYARGQVLNGVKADPQTGCGEWIIRNNRFESGYSSAECGIKLDTNNGEQDKKIWVHDNRIEQFGRGISVRNCENTHINDNVLISITRTTYSSPGTGHGIYIINSDKCRVWNNMVDDVLDDGIALDDCEDLSVKNNKVFSAGEQGISLGHVNTTTIANFPSTTTMLLAAGDGDVRDQYYDGRQFTVAGSTSNDGTYTVQDVSFSGGQTTVTITAASFTIEAGLGTSTPLTPQITNSIINGNELYDGTLYGIDEDSSCSGNDYRGNTFHNNTSGTFNLAGSGHKGMDSFIVAASDEVTALTTGTGKVTFRLPDFYVAQARISVTTAPTGSTLDVDVNDDGSSIFSTVLTIDATEKTSTTAATPAVISSPDVADDSEMTVDIDQIGSGTAGAGLKVTLLGYKV